MKYRHRAFTFIILLSGFCGYAQNRPGPLEVKYVNFRIETPMTIVPGEFDSAFSNREYQFWDLDQHDTSFNSVYSYLTQYQKVKQQSIDVRLEIIYSINQVEQKKWMNKFGVFTDGKNCYKNKNLYNFLKKTLNQ